MDQANGKQSIGRLKRNCAEQEASKRYRGLDRNNVIIPETGDVCSPGLSRLRRSDREGMSDLANRVSTSSKFSL